MRPATELATRIGRALISASTAIKPDRSWNPSLEKTLYSLGCRESLTPSLVARVIDPHLLSHHSLALGFFNWATQQPGFAHNSISYQSIFKSLSSSRQFGAIDSLLKQLKAQSLPLDSLTYSFVVKTLLQGKRTLNAFWVFNEAKSELSCLEPKVCNSLLAALSSEGYLENAYKVFEEMTRREVGFTTTGFGVFIWKLCAKNNLDVVLAVLDMVNNDGKSSINGSIIALLVVHGLCKASRVDEALWVLNELRMKKCKPDFMAYRIVAEALRSTGNVVDVNLVLKMKRKLGVAPRSDDYREFIFGLIAERLILEAKEIGEVITSGNFSVEDDVLNQLIGSVSSIDPCSAIMFFDFMVRKGTLPALLTLSILSKNLCKHNKIDELLDVYDRLSRHDYFSDMESCHVMFSFLCKAGRVREAYGALQEMKKKGLGPDISMYNSLMETCCRHDLIRPAKKLWDEMFVTGCGVNLRTYSILIGKLSTLAEVEEALRLFNHMSEKGVTPDAQTYEFLLEGLCRETKFEEAVEVFNKSVNQDVTCARNVLSTFIFKLCEKAEANEFRAAAEHVKWIQDTSPSMFHTIVSEVSASLSSSINPGLLQQLVQAMSEQGVDFRDRRNVFSR
ncbi:Pentatricopeptide repeat-containing protein At5g14080 [Linum perenne]